ncbi:MAG: leucine-rich repeat protein, partial [Treponema sp.]|nr:leucine-rich repeat protein [Treponema sp.]
MKEYNRLMKNRLSLKKYWISLFALCLILPLLFSSCNFDSDGGSKDNASYGYVTFSFVTLPGNFDHVVQREASRDIVPSMDTAVLSDLKLTGKAKNADGSYPSGAATTIRTAQTLSALNEDASAHKIKLRTGTWSLTLSASYEGITYSGTVETVIQEDENNSLSFALTPVLEDGKTYYGGVDLTVKYKGEATKAVLTLKSEDEATTYLTQELEIQSLSADPEDYDGKVEVIRSLSDAAERLVTGTYSLSIDFYGNETRDLYLNTYKENLVISPSLTSTETRKIYLNEIYSITYYVGALKVSQISDISFASSAPAVYSIRSEITLPSLVRSGFTFMEWRAGSETGPVIENIDTSTIRSNSYFNGRAKDVELYAKWDEEPFARVNETFCSTKDEVISLLENAGAGDELEIYFYGGAALTDIGKSSSSGTISYAIKNTNAAAVSVDLTEIKKSTSYNDTTFDFKECTKLKNFVNSAFSTYSIMSNMCEGCTALETVKIYPANTKIYPHAFDGCKNLREVIFIDRENSSCTSISYDAFFNCTSLENFEFPPKVSSVGNYAFYGCSSLESVTFSSTAEAASFSIGDYGFQNCTSLKSVILPENIVKIGQDCFRNCPVLEEITFKDTEYLWDFNAQSYVGGGVYEDVHLGYLRVNNPAKNAKYFSEIFTYDHSYSFQSTATKTDKTEIETTLKTGLFLNYLIKEICAGKSIKSFEPSSSFPEAGGTMPDEEDIYFLDDADDGDIKAWVSGDKLYYYSAENSLNGAKIKANFRSNKIFWECSWFEKIDLSPVDFSEVTTFENTFSGCTVLNNLILPDSMKTSNLVSMYGMFQNCKAIQNVSFPPDYDFSKVENLGYLFSNAIALRSVSFPSGITTENLTNMGNMFRTCSSLENIDLSDFDTSKVTDMGYTFSECTSLETIILSDKFTAVSLKYAGKMFANCSSLESLDLTHFTNAPDSEKLTQAGHMFDGCSNLKTLTLPSHLRIKGNVYDSNYNSGINYLFNDCKELTTINNLDKLDVEGTIYLSDVFSNCKKLTSIDISTFKIGGSGIENVYITGMFYGCSSLTSITLPSTIGAPDAPVGLNSLFSDCISLTDLSFLADSEIYSKKSLSSLFRNCTGLTSIVIPKSFHMVKTGSDSYVTWHMFNGCTNLKYIDISVLGMDDSLGSSYENYGLCLNCNSLETIVVGPDTKLLFKMYAPYNSSSSANPITGQVGTKNTSDDTSLYKTDSADSPGYFTSVYSVFVSGSDAAPAGSDTDGDGTKLKPFASITKAVEKINERITAGEDASGGEDTATTESRAYFTPGWSIIVKGNVPTNIELGEVKATSLLIQGTAYGATSSDPHGAENCILSGNNNGRIITVNEYAQATVKSPLTFKNIKITQGRIADSKGGALYINHPDCEVNFATGTQVTDNFAQAGGAIFSKSDVNVYANTLFSGNSTDTASTSCGGVFYITDSAKLIINGGIFNNNSSPRGGVLINNTNTEAEIKGGDFTGNHADTVDGQTSSGVGGIAYVIGTLTVSGGNLGPLSSGTANSAKDGGAICGGGSSSINISGGNICGNTAVNGGAVSSSSTVKMTGGSIFNNTATNSGGGLTVGGNEGKSFSFGGGSIYSNKSNGMGGGIYATGPV